MTSSSSLYGSTTTTGTVASDNYTTLYSTGTGTVANNNLVVPGTLTVNGCAILTNCTTFNLLPTTATTINFGNAATILNIGASTGITTINNQLALANYSFPVADGTANQVLTTDGAGNVYWALPGGGGSQFGNITIGITTDNTIDTTTGDLFITSSTGEIEVTGNLTVTGFTTTDYVEIPVNNTSNAIGIGGPMADASPGSDFWHIGGYSAGGAGNNDGALEIATANNGSEPIYVRQYTGGNTAGVWPYGNTVQRTLTLLDNNGATILPVSLTLEGSTSGSTTFTAPATGSTLSYVLPGTAGAANTVLTNDGSGNLTWALPGGGGSTFGNVTVGVATDNTVSTTTGDLILDSATNTVNVTATLELDGQLVVNTNNNINMEGRYVIDSATLTTSTTTADQVLASYSAATVRSAKFIIQIVSGTDYQVVEILAVHNGTNAFFTTYGDVRTGPNLAAFNMDINSGNFRLLTTPVNAVTTYKVAIPAAILA